MKELLGELLGWHCPSYSPSLSFPPSLCTCSGWMCGPQDEIWRMAHKTNRADFVLVTADGFGPLWILGPMSNSAKPQGGSGQQDRPREGRKHWESNVLLTSVSRDISFHSTHPNVFYPTTPVVGMWGSFPRYLFCPISGKKVWNDAAYPGGDLKPGTLYLVKYDLE